MRDSKDDFNCPLCGCRLLWFPVSHIFVCESCEQSFNEKAEAYLRHPTKSPVGSAAAMREALREAIGETCAGCKRDCDDCMNLKSGWMKKAKVALSAPARNCDRFSNADQAVGAYRQTHKNMIVNVFLDWLFAPAAERKGEGDGIK